MADAKELDDLTRRFGEFEAAVFEHRPLSRGFVSWIQRLTRRRGEIILVVPRKNGRVLLHTKPHYPDDLYRLPTGGVHRGEDAADAARREAYEEIGFVPRELKLLGVLENVFWIAEQRVVYPSFVFQTSAYLAAPKPTDTQEIISGFREADAVELRAAALHLSSLPRDWREWGKFRAPPHEWLAARWNG